MLCALEVAGHYSLTGKQLMQYIILFFPKHTRRFRAQKYVDRVLMPTVCCLHKCTNIEELYLENADSAAITTYLLAHILKFMGNLRILALPKQGRTADLSYGSINKRYRLKLISFFLSICNTV